MEVILHVFNSSGVAGIESLVVPALPKLGLPVRALFLDEKRRGSAGERPLAFAREQGLEPECVWVRGRLDIGAIRELAGRIAQLTPAIVHAHDVKASTYALAATRLLPRPPAIVSTHHGVLGRPNAIARAYEAFYVRAVLPRFDRVLCCSRADERNLLDRGILRERLVLHWNGVEGDAILPHQRDEAKSGIRRAWDVREDGIILGVVGRLSREKRHDRVLAVFAALSRIAPDLDWRLLCFGTGALAELLIKKTQELGLESRVHWMRFRPRIGREIAGFDVLLSLSDAEGMPLNVIEAGWAGTPVVATAVGGVLDLLGDPPAGRLVRPQDPPETIARAILDVLANPADLGRRLQQRVMAEFTQQAWLDRLRAIYCPLLEARGVHLDAHVSRVETICSGDGAQ
jgi:glycosyltransferase involved in cell wall biosynthesis